MSLAMSIHARGPRATFARTATVVSRFGATASAMARRLERYAAITSRFGARPSWPTTACVLERHPALLRRYADDGADLAVHGLVHGDHAAIDRRRQLDTIKRAMDIFERSGLRPVGFRGPYLRYNAATLEVACELGLRYHSSQAVAFPLVAEGLEPRAAASYGLALKLYSALDATRVAVTPRIKSGLVDIPVAVPDDEILLDRLLLDERARVAEWLHILEITYARGDLFTIQLHPERIDELAEALTETLAAASRKRPAVYIARLDEIAEWWLRRSRFTVRVTPTGQNRSHVSVDADTDATFLTRGLHVPRTPWSGRDALCELREFDVESTRLPVVGVSRRSPPAVRDFLAEEGFAVAVSDDQGSYGAHVDAGEAWSESDVLDAIEAAPGPLVRLWRWPNAARSALAATGDIDALTLRDFVVRSWETRDWTPPRVGRA